MRTVRIGLAGVVLGILCMGGAQATELLTGIVDTRQPEANSVQTVTLAGDWQVTCTGISEQKDCRMSTTASARTAKGSTITVQFASDGANDATRLFYFLTPLDLLLARGMEMRVDGGPVQKLAYRSCHSQGCIVPFRLTEALERSFQRGTTLALRLFEINGSAIDFEISLVGFIAASRTMQ